MGETSIDAQTGEEEPQCSLNKDIGREDYSIPEVTANKLRTLLGIQAEKELTSDSKQQLIVKKCVQSSLHQGLHATDLRIPKYIRFASLNENYLQYCLDLVEFRAANSLSMVCSPAVSCNISVDLISSKKDVLFDNKSEQRRHMRRNTSDLGPFVIQCPSLTRCRQWVVTTVDRNHSVGNILGEPVLHQLGSLDSIMNTARVGLVDVKGTKDTGSINFSSRLSISSPNKLETETVCVQNQKYGPKSLNKRLFSISNAKSTDSNQSSASSSATFSQGILQCKWENGIPYFMYTVNGQREICVAKVLKVESSDCTDVDYIYSFYTRRGGRKARGTCDSGSDVLVGKMKVSSSLTLCSSSESSKLMETEFVLFGADAKLIGNTAISDPVLGKTKVYPNKVVDIFRPKQLLKHRSALTFGSQSSISEGISLDPCESHTLNKLGSEKILGSSHNLELAAIVVKERVHDNHQGGVVGGWGLKFLEKVRVKCASTSKDVSVSCNKFQQSCPTHESDCSTNINVIIPAGFHGGPITRNGGPSGLTERWRSGGHCDCGGWDIGCPLTVLNNQSSEDVSTNATAEGERNALNLVIEGTKQSVPSLKMVNVEDGKYHIRFQSSFSALQTFSIGVSVIHTQSHSLGSKIVQKVRE